MLLLDFCKAFDKVPHSRLFHKLQFQGPLLTWIMNFLTDQSQQVILDNKQSNFCNVLSGVPQGSACMAPLLPLHVSNKVRLYADDVIMYSPHISRRLSQFTKGSGFPCSVVS